MYLIITIIIEINHLYKGKLVSCFLFFRVQSKFASLIIIALALITIYGVEHFRSAIPSANAHFFGVPILQNKTVGNYKIVFQPYPLIPIAEDNSTQINLSVLDNEGQNINLMFSSLSIKQKETGELVKTFPYRLYEFSDMTFPYTFPKSGTYVVTLNSKINGDPVYSKNPLVVDFDLPVRSGGLFESFRELMIYFLTPALIAITGLAIYLRMKKRI